MSKLVDRTADIHNVKIVNVSKLQFDFINNSGEYVIFKCVEDGRFMLLKKEEVSE